MGSLSVILELRLQMRVSTSLLDASAAEFPSRARRVTCLKVALAMAEAPSCHAAATLACNPGRTWPGCESLFARRGPQNTQPNYCYCHAGSGAKLFADAASTIPVRTWLLAVQTGCRSRCYGLNVSLIQDLELEQLVRLAVSDQAVCCGTVAVSLDCALTFVALSAATASPHAQNSDS